jgi:CDP-diacylglycerol--glycerol-3-phosphate 3-phosphatidyltransferase
MIDGRRGQQAGTKDEQAGAPVPSQEPEVAVQPSPEPAGGKPEAFSLGARLVRIGITANQVTIIGIVLAAVTGVVIGLGHLWLGVGFVTVGGLMDFLDGAVAKAAGTSSKRGAFFDSVSDRVADALIFGGVAWYLASGSQPRLSLLPFAILGVSAVISYERAKAESLGYEAKGGLMERAERLILLGVALAFNVILVPLLWLLLGLSSVTAAQRFVKVWRQASAPESGRTPHAAAWRRGRVESRWRTWRQPRTGSARRRAALPVRVRSRRRSEPLGTRLRRVLATERVGSRRAGTRSSQRRLGSGASLRRRLGPDR